LEKSHYGNPDRIGALWRSCGEDTPRFRIKEWSNDQLAPKAFMEVVKENEVGKTVQILKPVHEFREELHGTSDSCCARRLDRHVLQFLEGRANDADGTTQKRI
jgi:hypothetical protein